MKFSMDIVGEKLLDRKLKKLGVAVRKALEDAVLKNTLLVHSTAVKGIQKKSQGKSATRYHPKRRVTVSRPGDPPNTDRGRSIASVAFNFKPERLEGDVGTNYKVLVWLEFGTRDVAARPWLEPAFRSRKKQMKRNMSRAWRKATDKVVK